MSAEGKHGPFIMGLSRHEHELDLAVEHTQGSETAIVPTLLVSQPAGSQQEP